MSFMSSIITVLNAVSSWFYQLYYDSYYAGWPLNSLSSWFLQLYYRFNDLAWQFYYFSSWVTDIQARIVNFLSWDTVWSYILSYVPNLLQIRDWFYSWWNSVYDVVNSWWYANQNYILAWISSAASWTYDAVLNTINSLSASFGALQNWCISQYNSIQNTVLYLVSDIQNWTYAQINNVQNMISYTLGNIENWTYAQINSVTNSFLHIFTDLQQWTTTQINNMQAAINNLVSWSTILSWVTSWWNNQLLTVQSWINSIFLQYEPFWDGWQDIRHNVFDFFDNPVAFIWERFADWFLGPE